VTRRKDAYIGSLLTNVCDDDNVDEMNDLLQSLNFKKSQLKENLYYKCNVRIT